jgi:hypothetical protein
VEDHCECTPVKFSLLGLLETLTQDIVQELQHGPTNNKVLSTKILTVMN